MSDVRIKEKRSSFPLQHPGENGFTLIEVLITMVIFLVVAASVYGLLEVGRVTRDRASRRSDILKNARVAIQLIGRDALNAGLGFNKNGARVPDGFLYNNFQIPADADTKRDLLSSIVVGNNIFSNNLSANPATRTDEVAFCSRDLDFNPAGSPPTGKVIPLSNAGSQTGNPATPEVIADIAKFSAGVTAAKTYDLFLVENDAIQTAVMATNVNGITSIDAAPGDPIGINQPLNGANPDNGSLLRKCSGTTDQNCMVYLNATLTRFFLVSYHVKSDGTLVRTVYGNNEPPNGSATTQVQEFPLAYNIEDLQLRYVLDDGVVTDDPVAYTGDETAVNRIRQILVTIKVQSTDYDEQTRKVETITLNADFATRNMEYDAG